MLRWLAVLSFWTYLCSVTELHQLIKVPGFVEHFIEHTERDKDETFLCFLADHYLNGDHPHQDSEHDHELPFHCHHDCTGHAAQIAVPLPPCTSVVNIISSEPEPPVLEDASYSFLLSKDVWQPPKA